MLFASIDIGTNAARLLFANVYESKAGPVTEKASLLRIPLRLGFDVFSDGSISEQREADLLKTMQAFKLLIDVYRPVGYRVVATAAMREAGNNAGILERVKRETGLEINIIDGNEEAGIISLLGNTLIADNSGKSLYIDVGGGSTDVSVMENNHFVSSASFKIGTIRLLTEKVADAEWKQLRKWLRQFRNGPGRISCIGSGGNINKIIKLFGESLSNSISYDQLIRAHKQLKRMPLNERIGKMGLRPDRADVIVPAAEIFIKIMKWMDIPVIVAPKIGLADGLVLLQYKTMKEQGLIPDTVAAPEK